MEFLEPRPSNSSLAGLRLELSGSRAASAIALSGEPDGVLFEARLTRCQIRLTDIAFPKWTTGLAPNSSEPEHLDCMNPICPGGLLIVIEGVDGVGKTAVSAALAQHCGERGIACLYSKEPTGVGPGLRLRESADKGRLSAAAEVTLFQKDRAEHVRRAIRPALQFGAVVILDRYYWSTAAYQGARGFDPQTIITENERIFPIPDAIILLDLPEGSQADRIQARGDSRNEFEEIGVLAEVRAIFLELHHRQTTRSVLIDASVSLRQVQAEANAVLQKAMTAKGSRPRI